jgi:UDP-N-acetylglucosamine:LPS N-acetylglucosamine transferase
MTKRRQIAIFITPHGFGHAARACAVIEALKKQAPDLHPHIFTSVPQWFFEDSIGTDFTYHHCQTDIGLIQRSSLQEDLSATYKALDTFYPLKSQLISRISQEVSEAKIDLIYSDIAPLGLMVGKQLGIPGVLVENFTWDWIYTGYLEEAPEFQKFIKIHQAYHPNATAHIQTVPVCEPDPRADLTVPPVARAFRTPPEKVRLILKISPERQTVLVTMGGVQENYDLMGQFKAFPQFTFILPGKTAQIIREDNVLMLPYHSPIFHPDLVQMADAVIGKAGYSTLGEIYHAGVPFGYINREKFRESSIMQAFIKLQLPNLEISQNAFFDGSWIHQVPELLEKKKTIRKRPNGADRIASFLLKTMLSD